MRHPVVLVWRSQPNYQGVLESTPFHHCEVVTEKKQRQKKDEIVAEALTVTLLSEIQWILLHHELEWIEKPYIFQCVLSPNAIL